MNHLGTVKLETSRLILRRYVAGDAEGIFANWASDEEVTKYLTWKPHASAEVSAEFLGSVIKAYVRPDKYEWCIELKAIGEPIGSIAAVEVNDSLGIIHVGYCLGKKWWHEGIMSEAFAEVIRFFMEQVGAMRVESRHDPRNVYSGKVMKKCGLKYEGTLRRKDRNNQGICDAAWYGLLRDEYFSSSC
jgi:[ribosomal protein S5]-alanine N-acetyltransferase